MLELTPRQNVVVAVLASHRGAYFAPVQVQKLFFLLDENISEDIGGRQFAFEPYNYGPFDKAVYAELDALRRKNLVHIDFGRHGQRRYSLTPAGQEAGERALEELPERAREYISRAAAWVCSLSFGQLVGSIYRAYPHMRENSVFVE
jgi:hypothetical protein